MLNVDRVWARCSRLKQFQGAQLSDFVLQNINQTFQLTTGATSAQTPVNFPAGSIILGIGASARLDAVAATQAQSPGLDMFRVTITYQATSRSIVGPAALGSAVFGQYGDQFPGKELVIPVQGSLIYVVTNMTTSTIDVDFSHSCLVPGKIG